MKYIVNFIKLKMKSKVSLESNPVDIWSLIINRMRNLNFANVKCKQEIPVYLAWFTWQPSLLGNRLKTFHCIDICFWFFNTDYMLSHTDGVSRLGKLAEKMSGALVQFIQTGNPNGGGLPN